MKALINDSPYRTSTLKRIITTTVAAIIARRGRFISSCCPYSTRTPFHSVWWSTCEVHIKSGRRTKGWHWKFHTPYLLIVTIPGLTGSEFVHHARATHSNTADAKLHPAFESETLALIIQQAVYSHHKWKRGRGLRHELAYPLLTTIPQYPPVKIRRPTTGKPKEDIVTVRAARVEELLVKWERKLKLAQTKLKKLRIRRKHYAKKLAQRSTTPQE